MHLFSTPRVSEIRPTEVRVTRPTPKRCLCENAHKLDPHR
jgi:hypothetical protein